MFTGKILFPGRTNNHMLKLHMELKGKLSHKMIKRGQFGHKYFDEHWNFCSLEFDKLSGKEIVKSLQLKSATSDLKTRLPKSYLGTGYSEEDHRMLLQFIDLLDKCLQLNPEKRITPLESLRHPFITALLPVPFHPVNFWLLLHFISISFLFDQSSIAYKALISTL
ncbi:U4/U6 small nuclear ribonucleoprotein prp4 [Coelomomyces lativittatus]|nr:U4/U6 small nuclear ribonucleoprotein prp4 [Coelomomyces lativittatus]